MKKWIQTRLRPAIGAFLRRFPKIYDTYQKAFFYVVGKKKLQGMHKVGYEYADTIGKALEAAGIDYFYTYGSLLGLVREGGFIAHDEDIDFGVMLNEAFSWDKLEKCMNSIGFRKKHEFTCNGVVTEHTYMKNNLSVDFFAYEITSDNKLWTYYYIKEEGKSYEKDQWSVCNYETEPFKGMQTIDCHGISFRIPLEPEKYLETVYGPGWKVPDPNWVGVDVVIEDAVGYIVRNYE